MCVGDTAAYMGSKHNSAEDGDVFGRSNGSFVMADPIVLVCFINHQTQESFKHSGHWNVAILF